MVKGYAIYRREYERISRLIRRLELKRSMRTLQKGTVPLRHLHPFGSLGKNRHLVNRKGL